MPTYQYRCNHCGHEFEEFQQITEEPLQECPNCRTKSLVRVMGAGGGVIFKGSGFYLTDYKKDAGKKGGGKKPEEKKSDPKDSTADSGKKPPTPAAE